jgi:uncharacterized membrane protein YbhN (UPF0104 family)
LAACVLGGLYSVADWRAIWTAVRHVECDMLLAALALFVPQVLVSAWRWCWLASVNRPINYATSLAETLAASAINLFVPCKAGDFLRPALHVPALAHLRTGASATLREKVTDVGVLFVLMGLGALGDAALALALLGLVGLAHWMLTEWAAAWPRWQRCGRLIWHTSLLWALHMAQIYCFFRAAGIDLSWDLFLARMPLALFAGLIPLTPIGLGTRDAAITVLFADVGPAAALAVVGLLTATRYVVPGVAGLPFLWSYGARYATRLDDQREQPPAAGPGKRAACGTPSSGFVLEARSAAGSTA